MERLLQSLKKIDRTVLFLIGVLIVIRIFLPTGVKYGLNWFLDKKMDTYQGRVEDVDLAVYRGAYQLEGLKIWKRTLGEEIPLVDIHRIDLSLAWRAIFKGKLLGDITITEPQINLLDSADKSKEQFGKDEDWKVVISRLIPIEIESLKVTDGQLRFQNRDFKVPIELLADQIEIRATNIRNTERKKETLPSDVGVSARLQKDATAHLKGKVDAVSRIPAFDLNFSLKDLNLVKFNKFFVAYGPFTFTSGTFSMFSEIATKDNQVAGYVKPFIEKADIVDSKEKYISPKHVIYEIGLAIANLVVRDFKQKNAATKIEFKGNAKDPELDKWGAFKSAIENGFGTALKEKVDGSISLKDVPKKKKK